MNENQTGIGSVIATDPDGDTITYQIDSSEISIGLNSGGLTFNAAPDYETKSSYTAIVTASDGTNSSSQNITVNLNNLNDTAPVISYIQPLAALPGYGSGNVLNEPWTFYAAENSKRVAAVYMYDADEPTDPDNYYNCADSDPDISTPGTGTINAAMCYIDIGATGADYETKSQHTFTITPRDNVNTPIESSTVTINIINVNDNNPIITSQDTWSAPENQTAIGTVTATDADGDSFTFSVLDSCPSCNSGTNELSIHPTSGVLTFITAPDYETKSTYTALLGVDDGVRTVSYTHLTLPTKRIV